MGAGLALECNQVAGREAVSDKIARRIANIGDTPGFGDVVATRVGDERGWGVGECAASRINTPAHDHANELLDIPLRVLTLEEQTQVIHERGVLLGEGRVGLVSGERRSRTQQECGEN